MGYTHYWYVRADLIQGDYDKRWDAAVVDCMKAAVKAGIPIQDDTKPIGKRKDLTASFQRRKEGWKEDGESFTRPEICFNGIGEAAHETFCVEAVIPAKAKRDDRGEFFACCKTAGKPYDTVVCACLIILRVYFGDEIRVTSDGRDSSKGWADGFAIVKQACPHLKLCDLLFNADGNLVVMNDFHGLKD